MYFDHSRWIIYVNNGVHMCVDDTIIFGTTQSTQEASDAKRQFEVLFDALVTTVEDIDCPSSVLPAALKEARPLVPTTSLHYATFLSSSLCDIDRSCTLSLDYRYH